MFVIGAISSLISVIANERNVDFICFALVIIDLTLLIGFSVYSKWRPYIRNMTPDERVVFDQNTKFANDVLAEALFYPAFVCSVIGMVTDSVWIADLSDDTQQFDEGMVGDIIKIVFFVCHRNLIIL